VGRGGRASGERFGASLRRAATRYTEIADALHDPNSPVAKGIVGTANAMTAAICAATGDQPASACSTPAVQALRAKLP